MKWTDDKITNKNHAIRKRKARDEVPKKHNYSIGTIGRQNDMMPGNIQKMFGLAGKIACVSWSLTEVGRLFHNFFSKCFLNKTISRWFFI